MNYKAVEVIWIFLADGHTDGHTDTRTDRGVPRGPRGPKKNYRSLIYKKTHLLISVDYKKTIFLEIKETPATFCQQNCINGNNFTKKSA